MIRKKWFSIKLMAKQLAIDQSCIWLENGQRPTVILHSDYCTPPLTTF